MILVDGSPSGLVPASDRGLNYGDGLFETLRLHAGRLPLLGLHLARLEEGCRRLGLSWPGEDVLRDEVARVAAAGEEGVVKILLTRGDSGRGYAPAGEGRSRRVVSLHALRPPPEGPVEIGVCDARLGRNPALAGLKHTSRLEQVLGAREAAGRGWFDGLMRDDTGAVVEATRHNVFLHVGGRLVTPPLRECGVEGVMRALAIRAAAAAGLDCAEAPVGVGDLADAREGFLTNAVAGVVPVDILAGRPLPGHPAARAVAAALRPLGVSWLAA